MRLVDETTYKLYRPHLPIPDPETEPYWTAAREGKLLLKRCRNCAHVFFYPRSHCPKCWAAETEWVPSTGRGTVYSYTVIAHHDVSPFKDWLPYVVALVELEEGPRMVTHIVGVEPAAVRVGQAVEVVFERIDDTVTLPKFRPRA